MEDKIRAEMIVDLYEMRASTFPERATTSEKIQNNFQYQFFSSAIGILYEKYKVPYEAVEEEIRKRRSAELPFNL